MVKVVFFDLDGTVLDTLEDIADCMNEAFVHFGYKEYPYNIVSKSVGLDSVTLVRSLLGKETTEKKAKEIWDYYTKIVEVKGTNKTKVFCGIKEVVEELKKRGYKVCAFTNKTEEELFPFIEKYLDDLNFDKISAVGGTDKCKPSPKEVLFTLEEYGVLPENAYVVGDGETDVLTAINAGATPIAVLWGNRTKEQLKGVGAKLFANTPEQLLSLIK